MQRQALDDERHRIARELHDSVTQSVLSIGMTIEMCRAELANMAGPASQIAERLGPAKDLARHAAEQLRTAIYALNHAADEPAGSLPVMLQRLSTVHQPVNLNVKVRLEGQPIPLPPGVEQSVLRWTGEALFNAAAHGQATCALVRLRYLPGAVTISVSDNGTGDPAQLRRALRLSSGGDLSGLHRGLANMLDMSEDLGGYSPAPARCARCPAVARRRHRPGNHRLGPKVLPGGGQGPCPAMTSTSHADRLRHAAATTLEECHDHRAGISGFRLSEIRVNGKSAEGFGGDARDTARRAAAGRRGRRDDRAH